MLPAVAVSEGLLLSNFRAPHNFISLESPLQPVERLTAAAEAAITV